MKTFAMRKIEDYARDLTSLGNPIILTLIALIVLGLNSFFFKLLLIMIANELIVGGIKFFFFKKRPNGQKFKNVLEKIDAGSFPSLHTSRVTLVFLTLGFVQNLLWFTIPFIFVVGCTRVYLKKHFVVDVVGGLVLGTILFTVALMI